MNKKRSHPSLKQGLGVTKGHGNNPIVATILIVFALKEERDYFHSVVSRQADWEVTSPRNYYFCHYTSKLGKIRVAVKTLEKMGHIPAVVGTSSAVIIANPSLAILVGIAGSLNPSSVGLGDVVVSNQVKFYSSDKVMSHDINDPANKYKFEPYTGPLGGPLPDGSIIVDDRDKFLSRSFFRYERQFVESASMDGRISAAEIHLNEVELGDIDANLLPAQMKLLPSAKRKKRQIHYGWLLGSNNVVDSQEYRDYLIQKNNDCSWDIHRQKLDYERALWADGDLIAVDMESYGFLKAIEQLKKINDENDDQSGLPRDLLVQGGIVVKGISDLCEDKGALDKSTQNKVREVAAQNATLVALKLIESFDYHRIIIQNAVMFNIGH